VPQLIDAWIGQVVVAPEQNDAGVNNEPLQAAAAHIAVEFLHAPAPSQLFVFPHAAVVLAPQRVSVAPDAIAPQLPMPFTLQAWQAGQLALPQQTPSTQLPLMHWLAAVQATPFAFRLQLLAVPEPWQVNGATQSLSAAQVDLHAPLPHTYGEQLLDVDAAQEPVPLQCAAGVNVDPLQLAAAQVIVVGACWQPPVPLQAPVLPQGDELLVGHSPCGSAAADGTFAHVPRLPETLHAWQVPQDFDPQQTPSTQVRPVRQSPVAEQVCPCRCNVPHRLVFGSQMFGDRQFVSTVHVELQLVVPLQTYGAHEVVVAARQVPAPSQVRALVCVDRPLAQVEATQTVPAA
jgi:hypothetical protein